MCFVTDCSLFFLVFLSKLLLNFYYFCTLPKNWRKSIVSCEDWSDFLIYIKSDDLFCYEEKGFQRKQSVNDFRNWLNDQRLELYLKLLVLSFLLFILNFLYVIVVYTPIHGTNREKCFFHVIYKGKMPTLGGNKHLFVHFFSDRPCLFHISTEKCTGLIRQKRTAKWLFPHWHNK